MLNYLCLSPLQTGFIWRTLSAITFLNVFGMLAGHMYYMFEHIADLDIMGTTCTTVSASIQVIRSQYLQTIIEMMLINRQNITFKVIRKLLGKLRQVLALVKS